MNWIDTEWDGLISRSKDIESKIELLFQMCDDAEELIWPEAKQNACDIREKVFELSEEFEEQGDISNKDNRYLDEAVEMLNKWLIGT